MASDLHVTVLAAGEGKRLGGGRPKVLTPLWGRPSLQYTLDAAATLEPGRTVVVGGQHLEAIREALADRDDLRFALQDPPLGTGHAVLSARSELEGAQGSLLVLYGDGPLVRPELLAELVATHRSSGAPLTILTIELDDPTGYGRILRDDQGEITGIVEEKDCSDEQRALTEVNAGLWIFDLDPGLERLATVGTDNAQGEIYLTDLAAVTVAAGDRVASLEWPEPEDVLGFNTHRELALVREILRWRLLERHLEAGVEIVDPASTFVDADVTLEPGARILPGTVIEGRSSVAAGCVVGPFSHLRDGTLMQAGSKVGNFTETKNTTLGPGAKASHLTYLGDATVGADSNIGAGTITANYDGTHKHPTAIGARVFVGSGTVLVAPATLEDGVTTGAGAVVPGGRTLEAGSTWVGVPARRLDKHAGTTREGEGA